MSCKFCQVRSSGTDFPSEKDFVTFQRRLNDLVLKGGMKKVNKDVSSSPFFVIEYQCVHCGQEWMLEIPDQAFRGRWKEVQ